MYSGESESKKLLKAGTTNQPSPQRQDRDPPLFLLWLEEVSKQEWTRGGELGSWYPCSQSDGPGASHWTSLPGSRSGTQGLMAQPLGRWE